MARYWFSICICLACWPTAAWAVFDETDVIQIHTWASLIHDDNLFRLPDADPRLFGVSPDQKEDTVRVVGVGLRLDKSLSRQRLFGHARFSKTKFENNPDLDNDGRDLRLSWFWRVGNHWDGELRAADQKYQAGFGDDRFIGRVRDIINARSYLATAGYRFHPRWRVSTSVATREAEHSAESRTVSDFESTGVTAALMYETPAGNSIGAEVRRSDGKYPNRVTVGAIVFDNGYTETEANGLLEWQLTGALKLNAALGWTERRHDNLPERDFSGATGRITATWEPTSKLSFKLTGNRDIRSFEDTVANYVLLNSVSLTPIWAVSSKVTVQGALTYETREYLGDPGIVVNVLPTREDTLRRARVGVHYSPLRYLDVSFAYERGERRSNLFVNEYDYQTVSGTLQLRF